MSAYLDPRVVELEQLAREEGIKLPYPSRYICWLEDRGRIVDLATGEVYNAVISTPTRHAQAVAYLLGEVQHHG
jgi:hypothetical protein